MEFLTRARSLRDLAGTTGFSMSPTNDHSIRHGNEADQAQWRAALPSLTSARRFVPARAVWKRSRFALSMENHQDR